MDIKSIAAVCSFLLLGCHSGKIQQGIKAGTFYAVCEEKLPLGSHGPTGWCGPKRGNNDDARADTTQHSADFPGHHATICSGSCPTCEVK